MILETFGDDLTVQAKIAFQDMCVSDFASGDWIHWCVHGHCDSDTDAFDKTWDALAPILRCGYRTPLLYRMKHMAPAVCYWGRACEIHSFLPQVLLAMSQGL